MCDPFTLMFEFIILLSGFVKLRVVFREMFAEIFEQTWTSHLKVQASTLTTNRGRPNANKRDSGLVTGLIGEMNNVNLGYV